MPGGATTSGRQKSYALVALQPMLMRDPAPPDALILAATAAQYLHRFDPALEYLRRTLAQRPQDATALLMRANLPEVRGELVLRPVRRDATWRA